MNTLKLTKCAYIADSSHKLYFYGKKDYEESKKLQSFFKQWYENFDSMKNTEIPFNCDNDGNIYIIFNDKKHYLNSAMIAEISDKSSIINKRKYFTAEDIKESCTNFHLFCHDSLYSNDLKSLYFEFYTKDNEELLFIRVHFRNNCERFIISTDNKFYTDGYYGKYKEISIKYLLGRLEIKSNKAKTEFYQVINAILDL